MKMAALRASTGLTPAAGVILMAAPTVEDMLEERDALLAESETIVAAADGDERDLTADEDAKVKDILAQIKALDGKIETRQAIAAARTPPANPGAGRKTTPDASTGNEPTRRVPASPRDSARHGFNSFGEFALGARSFELGIENEAMKKIAAAATTWGNEGTGADGGFLVPPEFSRAIWQKVQAEENLLNRCAQLQIGSNSIAIPKDEEAPWDHTTGVRVYWEGEGHHVAQSKPSFELSTVRLSKLMALVPLSDELLDDAIGLESWLQAKAPAKMAAKINTSIVDGTGVGQPLGILRAPSRIEVTPNVSQPADSIWFENISNMWARMYAPWRRNAVWLINQDIEPQLDQMAFDPTATAGKVPIYLPNGSAASAPYATLKNRPVVPIEACKTLGDAGDIILVDLMQYWAITKAGGIKTDTSIHLFFDQALTAFRFMFRLNGQPAWSSTIAPENGNVTRSWAVTLGARS